MASGSSVFFLRRRRPPRSPLFPYTTLFRSRADRRPARGARRRWERRAPRSAQPVERERPRPRRRRRLRRRIAGDRKSTRLNSSHVRISYAVFCLKKKKKTNNNDQQVKNNER